MKDTWENKLKPGLLWFFKSFIWLGILMLAIDIVSKNLVVLNQDYILSREGGHGIILIPNFLAINYVVNYGAAFGLSSGNDLANRIVYIVIASLVIAGLLAFFCLKFKKLRKFYRATIMLILVGALGNLIDRLAYAPSYLRSSPGFGVVDWINFFGIWGYNFNIADSCIVVGVIMLIIYLIIDEIKDSKKSKVKLAGASNSSKQEKEVNITNEVIENKTEEKVTEEVKNEPVIETKEDIKETKKAEVKEKAKAKKKNTK